MKTDNCSGFVISKLIGVDLARPGCDRTVRLIIDNRQKRGNIKYLRELIAWNRRNGFRDLHDHERLTLAEIYREVAGRHPDRFAHHIKRIVKAVHSLIKL